MLIMFVDVVQPIGMDAKSGNVPRTQNLVK